MKKVLSFLFAAMMLFAVSCSNSTKDTATQTDTTVCDSVECDSTLVDTIEGVDSPIEVPAAE